MIDAGGRFLNWPDNDHHGAGRMLVVSAADVEESWQPRPDLPATMDADLEPMVRILAARRRPWRLNATDDETISRALDVLDKVDRDIPLGGLGMFLDHAETIPPRNMDRVAALGGGILVQHRMARFSGEAGLEGAIAPALHADLALLSDDLSAVR